MEFGTEFRSEIFRSEFSVEFQSRIMEWVVEFWSRTLEFGMELEQNFGTEIWYMTGPPKC